MHRHTSEWNEHNQPDGHVISDNPTMLNTSHGNAKEHNRSALESTRARFFVHPQTHTQKLRPRSGQLQTECARCARDNCARCARERSALATLANVRASRLVARAPLGRASGADPSGAPKTAPSLRTAAWERMWQSDPLAQCSHTETRLGGFEPPRLGEKTNTPPRSGPIGAIGKRLIPRRY